MEELHVQNKYPAKQQEDYNGSLCATQSFLQLLI